MLIMPPDLALLSTLISSNYPCLELIFMVPKMFEPLKFYCISPKLCLTMEINSKYFGTGECVGIGQTNVFSVSE